MGLPPVSRLPTYSLEMSGQPRKARDEIRQKTLSQHVAGDAAAAVRAGRRAQRETGDAAVRMLGRPVTAPRAMPNWLTRYRLKLRNRKVRSSPPKISTPGQDRPPPRPVARRAVPGPSSHPEVASHSAPAQGQHQAEGVDHRAMLLRGKVRAPNIIEDAMVEEVCDGSAKGRAGGWKTTRAVSAAGVREAGTSTAHGAAPL